MVRRSGLGRGLGALIPAGVPDTTSGPAFRSLDIAHIVPNRYQPRSHFDEEALLALAASIAEIGVIQPIMVREINDGYEIITGERRWRAAQRAGLTKIPALIRSTDDKETLELAIIENVHREDLNVLEEAAAYRQLIDDFGLTQSEVASRVGRSRSTITNTIRLLHLPVGVHRMIIDGQLSAGHGRALLALDDDKARQSLADEIARDNLSVREVERRVAASRAVTPKPDSDRPDKKTDEQSSVTQAGILELEVLLARRLDTRVSVRIGQKRGRITISFADLNDLERIYKVITPPGTHL